MKQLLVFLLFLVFSTSVNGQNQDGDVKSYDYYCVFYGEVQVSGKVKPQKLIWGENKEEVKLTTSDGKSIDFNNMVDAANFLSKRGWKYLDCEIYHSTWCAFFVKTVKNDEEAKESLHFDVDFKKE